MRTCEPAQETIGAAAAHVETIVPTAKRSSWSGPLAAIAASVVIAFGLGWIARTENGPSTDEPHVISSIFPGVSDNSQQAAESQPTGMLNMVSLAIADPLSGAFEEVQLPVRPADQIDAELEQQSSALIRELEQLGHQVTAYRNYWPVGLEDGRTLVVPIDEMHVTGVKDRTIY